MGGVTLFHLSDLHIGRSAREADRSLWLFEWISSHYPGAPVLLTGDLTDSGTRKHCSLAQPLLKRLAAQNPVLMVPGNHDYGFLGIHFQRRSWENWYQFLSEPRGWSESANWSWLDLERENFIGVLEHEGIAYFGLDSCDPDDYEVCARGLVSKKLARALESELHRDKYRNKTRIVMLHHHPFGGSFLTALHGSGRLMRAISGKCDILLFGHHHHCGVWQKRHEIPLVVGSHKSTDCLFGDFLGVGLIEVRDSGRPGAIFDYRMEAVDLGLLKAA